MESFVILRRPVNTLVTAFNNPDNSAQRLRIVLINVFLIMMFNMEKKNFFMLAPIGAFLFVMS